MKRGTILVAVTGHMPSGAITKALVEAVDGLVVIPADMAKKCNTVTIEAPYNPPPPLPMMPKQYAPWGKKGRRENRYGQ